MSRSIIVFCLALVALAGFRLPVLGQNQKLQTREIFVFPGNVAFFYKEGNLAFRNRRVVLADVPNALYGTYWLKPGGNFNILKTEFGQDTVYYQVDATTMFQVLKANVGAVATVTYKIGQEIEDVKGEVLPFVPGSNLARIRTVTGTTRFIQEAQVQLVAIEGPARTYYYEPVLGEATIIEIDKNLSSAPLRMFYYTKGITWEPSYGLRILSDTTVQFSMKAVLDNQAEAFTDATVKFVLGTANLTQGAGLDGTVSEMLRYLQGPAQGGGLVRSGQGAFRPDSVTPAPEDSLPQDSTGQDDQNQIFVYEVGQLSMGKNTKALVPVFEKTVPARSIYLAKLPLNVSRQNGEPMPPTDMMYTPQTGLRFQNATEAPLMPGTLLLLNASERPMGQMNLPALRPGQSLDLAYGSASDIQVIVTEKVAERLRIHKGVNENFEQITVRGMVRVNNLSRGQRDVQVTQEVLGRLGRTSNGTVTATSESVMGNPVSTLVWNIPVASQGSQAYPYEYVYTLPVR